MPHTITLEQIQVASPCPADWELMSGDEQVRHCAQCDLNVYNISMMSEEDALSLIESREGRLCVRLYRRADGTILTQDCPKGLARIRRRARIMRARIAAVFAMVLGGAAIGRAATTNEPMTPEDEWARMANASSFTISDLPGIRTVKRWMNATPPAPQRGWVGGVVCVQPPPAPPTQGED